MTFRTRVFIACLAVSVIPLALLAAGVRTAVRERMSAQYDAQAEATLQAVRGAVAAQAATIDARLGSLEQRLLNEPRLRSALLDAGDVDLLVDFAASALPGTGLDHQLLLDERGRVLSSGHFRLDYSGELPAFTALARRGTTALAAARRPAGELIALVRARDFAVGERRFVLAGGVAVDSAFVARLGAGAAGVEIALAHPGGVATSSAATGSAVAESVAATGAVTAEAAPGTATTRQAAVTQSLTMPFVTAAGELIEDGATWRIAFPLGPLHAVLRSIDLWLLAALGAAVALALITARLLAARVTRPLEELAKRAQRVELTRYDSALATTRSDEIGSLSRLLDRMVQRLRADAQQLRDAERRATVGDMARQVNHDIRNGLLPIRNVVTHLAEVAHDEPDQLGAVFAERESTLRSGIGYLESLATNYARLTPRTERQRCDVEAVLGDALRDSAAGIDPRVTLHANGVLPAVTADPVALRRVVENLTLNALESLPGDGGSVTISAVPAGDGVVITVADTGSGMAPDVVARIFDDFYTTRERGTGLGLSIVRRLVADMGGRIRVDSEPGRGTTYTIELPPAS